MYKAHCNICDSIMTDAMTPAYHTTSLIKGQTITIEVYVKTKDDNSSHICISCLRQTLQSMEFRTLEKAREAPH